jgi:hypothetical protein
MEATTLVDPASCVGSYPTFRFSHRAVFLATHRHRPARIASATTAMLTAYVHATPHQNGDHQSNGQSGFVMRMASKSFGNDLHSRESPALFPLDHPAVAALSTLAEVAMMSGLR